ncbi:AMP-binding protein [Cytobacillus depressus]|uniref:AMP-binding protein n=1 Tax=Cytobacillus depressus TaxID=1602942 RepID=A0A6L3V564_9BACI|nr:AMP-binding protein [Cytobacillus depressus]KAB2336259.1 AMP-binding protein [Cytobacillus depressus]
MTNITDSYKKHAADFPEKMAVYTNGWKISYKEWNEMISKTANWLHSQQSPNKIIALLLPNGIPLLQLFAGASMAGWTSLPLDLKWNGADLDKRLKLANPSIIITNKDLSHRINHPNVQVWDDCLKEIKQSNSTKVPTNEENPQFYMGFTSGTTGDPKAFVRSHESWVASFACNRYDFRMDENEHVLIPGALVHSHFLYGAISTLALGGTVYLLEKFSPIQTLSILQTQKISTVYVVPTMVESLLNIEKRIEKSFKIISSGAKWAENSKLQIRDMFPNLKMFEFYGASELSFISVLSDDDSKRKADSVGRPCFGVEIQIRQANNRIAKPYETGKIYVRSKLFFSGYLNPETRRIQSIQDEDGWASVNDMGYLDEDGFVYITGRENNMILYGAINIFPEEIEKVISLHPNVEEVAVIGISDEYWGQIVTAVIKGTADTMELKKLCKLHLSSYKIPRKWYLIDQVPYTTSGKIARSQLKEIIEKKVNSH